MKQKAVVLLSAGLDSSVNLFEALEKMEVVLALTFDYGQKAARREIESAAKICRQLRLTHKVVSLPWFKDFNRSSLLVDSQEVPTGTAVQIDDLKTSKESAKSVWVPNRNGIFLNIAAAFAEALDAGIVVPGFNAEEAVTFPDNSEAFMKKLDQSFSYSTSNQVRVECFTVAMNKIEIVKRGDELQVPWHLTWPCYFSRDKWCGQCESCLRAKRAFTAADIPVLSLFAE